MVDQVKAGLASPDAAITSAAKQARNSIVANANFSDLLWKGYEVNSRVVRQQDQISTDVRYSVIYEAGQLQLSEKMAIDVGRPAFIEMTETPLNRGSSVPRMAASSGAAAGPVSNVGSEADTYVFNGLAGLDVLQHLVDSHAIETIMWGLLGEKINGYDL